MSDDQMHALQEQRHREAMAVEIAALRAHEERARWCEEKQADVTHKICGNEWTVAWYEPHYRMVRNPDRNAAIDAAMKGGR